MSDDAPNAVPSAVPSVTDAAAASAVSALRQWHSAVSAAVDDPMGLGDQISLIELITRRLHPAPIAALLPGTLRASLSASLIASYDLELPLMTPPTQAR